MNLQISTKHTLEEIIILELKFGTKRKNRKLRLISQTSGIESIIISGRTDRRRVLRTFNGMSHEITIVGMYFELLMECLMKLRRQALNVHCAMIIDRVDC